MNKRFKHLFLFVAMWIAAIGAWGEHVAQHKSVHGMDIYYGVVPAQVVQAHIKEHAAQPMHKKSLFTKGAHHLVVTLYDAKTSQRINDATVSATVTPLGLSPESKTLEVMRVDDSISYGNYFNMPPSDSAYRISLSIKRPVDQQAATVELEYRHAASR